MPPLFIMCVALAGALFFALLACGAYVRMKLEDPEEDAFMKLQKDMYEDMHLGGLARVQRSKIMRVVSFVLMSSLVMFCLIVAIWHGYLALV